jgi:hypothetical protein
MADVNCERAVDIEQLQTTRPPRKIAHHELESFLETRRAYSVATHGNTQVQRFVWTLVVIMSRRQGSNRPCVSTKVRNSFRYHSFATYGPFSAKPRTVGTTPTSSSPRETPTAQTLPVATFGRPHSITYLSSYDFTCHQQSVTHVSEQATYVSGLNTSGGAEGARAAEMIFREPFWRRLRIERGRAAKG